MTNKKHYTSKEAKKRLKNYVLKNADELEQEIIEDRKTTIIKKEKLNYA